MWVTVRSARALGPAESRREAFPGCRFGAADPLEIPIDPNGNLTQKVEGSDTWAYTWNAENLLTKVEKNGIEVARFAYDPNGRRVEKIVGGVATGYTYDRQDILRESRAGATLKYVHGSGIDEPLAFDDGTEVTYFHADGLGSIIKTTSATGAVTLTRQYDAWGDLEIGSSQSGYAFTGREWEPEIALLYFRARYYDPRAGSFIGEDPMGPQDGDGNRYLYVRDNPVRWSDPLGLFTEDTFPPAQDLCKKYGSCPPPAPPTCEGQCLTELHQCYARYMYVYVAEGVVCRFICKIGAPHFKLICQFICTMGAGASGGASKVECYAKYRECLTVRCRKPPREECSSGQ